MSCVLENDGTLLENEESKNRIKQRREKRENRWVKLRYGKREMGRRREERKRGGKCEKEEKFKREKYIILA